MKCVILIDQALPLGLIANCASVLSITLGHRVDGIVGYELEDNKGRVHAGITALPIPILKSDKTALKALREELFDSACSDCLVVDFTHVAQRAKVYDDYADALSSTDVNDLDYLGIALYGPKKSINKLTGSLPLLH